MAGAYDRFRKMDDQFGNTDFTNRSRRSIKDRARRPSLQPESSTSGRSNPPVTLEERDRVIDRGVEAANSRGFSQTRKFDNGGSAEISFPRKTLLNRRAADGGRIGGFEDQGQDTPNVATVPSEVFTNPSPYVGYVSPEQQKAREQDVLKDIRKERRQAEIDSDMEFRRNLRQRKLLDDANLNLSGNMTLTELANAASRRRNARKTLREQDATAAEQRTAAADRQVSLIEERGRNRREGLKQGVEADKAQDAQYNKAYTRAINMVGRRTSFKNEDGESVEDPGAVQRFQDFASAEGLDITNLKPAEQKALADISSIAEAISRETGISLENVEETMAVIGSVNEEFLSFIDGISNDLDILDSDGKVRTSVALKDIASNPAQFRTIRTIISDKVKKGELTNRSIKPWLLSLFQRTDKDFASLRSRK